MNLIPFLTPPGSGVYTVHTGASHRRLLENILYGCQGPEAASMWHAQLSQLNTLSDAGELLPSCFLLGIPSDAGGGIQRGANWGPLAVRKEFYLKEGIHHFFDLGDIRTIPQLVLDEYCSDSILASTRKFLYGDENSFYPVSPLSITQHVTAQLHLQFPSIPIISLGGDHSVSYPLIQQYLQAKTAQNKRVAIIHFDAHTDLLESRMGIPVCFGSWVYSVLPLLRKASDFFQIGIRSSGREKQYWESQYGISQIWMQEIRDKGIAAALGSVLTYLKNESIEEIYITFDIDALDASIAGATGTPEPDGLTLDEALWCIEQLRRVCRLGGADLVEVAPFVGLSEIAAESTLRCSRFILKSLGSSGI